MTGGASGVGRELVNILYGKNGTVYIAARSQQKSQETMTWCQSEHPNSSGQLRYLHLDLNDLSKIEKAAQDIMAKETRLDVLWNNAGVMLPPAGSITEQVSHIIFYLDMFHNLTYQRATSFNSEQTAWGRSYLPRN